MEKKILLNVENMFVCYPKQVGNIIDIREPKSKVFAVEDVSFQIDKGKIFALIGESGCGKTTLGKAILRLLRCSVPPNGAKTKIEFRGRELYSLNSKELLNERRFMQMVFQNPNAALNPHMKIGEIMQESFNVKGGNYSERDIVELLDSYGLGEEKDYYPYQLSGGEKRRTIIARCMALSPELIVADEMTADQDKITEGQIVTEVKDRQMREKTTIVYISHNIHIVSYMADYIAVMFKGIFVQIGHVENIIPADLKKIDFIKEPYDLTAKRNLLPLHPYTKELIGQSMYRSQEAKGGVYQITVNKLPGEIETQRRIISTIKKVVDVDYLYDKDLRLVMDKNGKLAREKLPSMAILVVASARKSLEEIDVELAKLSGEVRISVQKASNFDVSDDFLKTEKPCRYFKRCSLLRMLKEGGYLSPAWTEGRSICEQQEPELIKLDPYDESINAHSIRCWFWNYWDREQCPGFQKMNQPVQL